MRVAVTAVCAAAVLTAAYFAYIFLIVPRGDIVRGGDTEPDDKNYAYAEAFVPEFISELEENGAKVEKYTVYLDPAYKNDHSNSCFSFYAVVRLTDSKKAEGFFDDRDIIALNSFEMAHEPWCYNYKEPFRHMGYASFLQLDPNGRFIEYFGVLPNNVRKK